MTSPTGADLERLRATQRALQHVVRATGSVDEVAALAASGFEGLGLTAADAAALTDQDPRRLFVYRKLVRGTMVDAIAAQIPRAAARLGDRYDALVHAFCDEELPRSRMLRDVPFELGVWARPRLEADPAIPPYLADLLRFELFEFDVYAARATLDEVEPTEELAADQLVAFCGTMRIARFDHAVHRLPDDPLDRSEPDPEAHGILAYRDGDGHYRQLELTPLATAIFARMWLDAMPLASAVQAACEAEGVAITAEVIQGTSEVLEDLAARGVALGGRDAPPPSPSPFCRWLFDPRQPPSRPIDF